MTPIEDGTLSVKEPIDVVLRDDAVFAASEVIPPKKAGSPGRSRNYPPYVWTLWPELKPIFRTHTGVERELGRGGWWRYIRRELKHLRPELAELPPKPPRRQDFEYMRDRYLATDEAIERSLELHTRTAAEQAKEAGNLDLDGPGSFTHPDITRTLYGDGKVFTPLYTAKSGTPTANTETSEARQRRFDPDADWHTEGGGERVWGIKFAHVSTRRAEGRFILGVEHVEKDEAKAALEILRRLKPHAPGAQAVVWDMILRGDHLQEIMTELGLVPVVKVHAKENADGGKGRRAGTYVPKTLDLDSITVTLPDGTDGVVQIAACDGWASVKELTETGEPHYERLERGRLQRHEDTAGYRWYGYYKLPAAYGGKVVPVRHHQNADDDRRGLNRTENLRPIPEGSEDFAKLHVLRPDAESINRGLEDSLFINRASAKGWRRQMVDLLGHARLVNATTLARCRARTQLASVA